MKNIKIIFALVLAACFIPGMALAELKLQDHIGSLKLKGDLRVRYERHDRDEDANKDPGAEETNNPRDRLRTRFRLGACWKAPSEKWEVGAGFATGGSSSTSTNDTWSDPAKKTDEMSDENVFRTGDFRLDYAYGKHNIDLTDDIKFNIIIGQQKNPFKSSWLLWDSDIRPAGFTGQADLGVAFVTFGGYDVYQNGNDIAMMYALQGGTKIKTGNIKICGALSLYTFSGLDRYGDNDGGNYVCKLPNKDYDYQIFDFYGKIDISLDKKVKISPYIQVFSNIGAGGKVKGDGQLGGDLLKGDEETMGYVFGAKAKVYNASFKLSYAEVGADSCIPYLKNQDWGSKINEGVNVKGAVVAAGYNFFKHFSTELTAYLYEPAEKIDSTKKYEQNMSMYHIDMKYKF